MAVLSFASLVYICETDGGMEKPAGDSSSSFGLFGWTFLDSLWWCIMTLTTVGEEGNPDTVLGRMAGAACALAGVFLLTLPFPIGTARKCQTESQIQTKNNFNQTKSKLSKSNKLFNKSIQNKIQILFVFSLKTSTPNFRAAQLLYSCTC